MLAATHAATALATTDDDPIPPIVDDEQMLLRYQAQIDQCVHMLKTKQDMIERYEKQVAALLERVPRAVFSRDRRVLQKQVDEFKCPFLARASTRANCQGKVGFSHAGGAREARTWCCTKHFVGPEEKSRGTNTNIVAPVRFCTAYIPSLPSQRRRLLRMFQSTAFHRFGLLRRVQFDCQEQIDADETVIILEIPQAPQVVDSFPSLEKFVAPMCNQVLLEQIVATVRPQEIQVVQVVERIQEQIIEPIDVLAPAVTCAAPSNKCSSWFQ